LKLDLKIKRADYRKLSDEELVRHYMELHEYPAYNFLFERYAHIVLGICLRRTGNALSARSAMEDVFLQMSHDIKALKTGKFQSWLYSYVTGQAESVQGSGSSGTLTSGAVSMLPGNQALAGLSREEQRCVKMFYEGNKSFAQICKATGMAMPRLKAVLQSAKVHMSTELHLTGQLAHIQDQSACLTAGQLRGYANDNMEIEECHAVEHHLTGCLLCSAAIEGMQLAPVEGAAVLDTITTRFLNDHFSIAYPQVHVSSFVADATAGNKKKAKIPVWVNVALGVLIATVVVVVFYAEKHRF